MAIVSKFERGGTEVDLNDASTGFSLAGDGWLPAVATPVYMGDPEPVTETLYMRLKDTSQDNIATDMQALHQMQVWADQYMRDQTIEDPVWFHAKMDSETGERRTLVHKIEVQYGTSWYSTEATAIDIPVIITVTRSPYWERTASRDFPDSGSLEGASVIYDYTAAGDVVTAHDIVGDVGARIEELSLDLTTNFLDRMWFGLRTKGTLANFVPIWECEDGTNEAVSSDDTTSETNTASPGSAAGAYVEGTPTASDTWEKYFDIRLDNVTVNETDNLGLFLWLLRAKVASSNVFEVQFRYGYDGYMADADFVRGPIIEIDSTNWDFLEMGSFRVPLEGVKNFPNTTFDLGNFSIQVWAQRTTGSSTILYDCICPIPIDEGYAIIKENAASASQTITAYVGESPTGNIISVGVDGNNIGKFGSVDVKNFRLPPGDGRMIAAYARASNQTVLTDSITFVNGDEGDYYERWLSLRGSE